MSAENLLYYFRGPDRGAAGTAPQNVIIRPSGARGRLAESRKSPQAEILQYNLPICITVRIRIYPIEKYKNLRLQSTTGEIICMASVSPHDFCSLFKTEDNRGPILKLD